MNSLRFHSLCVSRFHFLCVRSMIFNPQIPPFYKQKRSCEQECLLAHVKMLTGTNSTQLEAQERLFLVCKPKNRGSFHTVWPGYIWFDPLEGTAIRVIYRRVAHLVHMK